MTLPMVVVGVREIHPHVHAAGFFRASAARIINRETASMFCNSQPLGSLNCRGNT